MGRPTAPEAPRGAIGVSPGPKRKPAGSMQSAFVHLYVVQGTPRRVEGWGVLLEFRGLWCWFLLAKLNVLLVEWSVLCLHDIMDCVCLYCFRCFYEFEM